MPIIPKSLFINRSEISIQDYGAVGDDSTDNSTFITNSFSAGNHIVYPSGTYLINTTGIYGSATSVHQFIGNAKIRVPNGVTVTLRGTIEADPDTQIFEVDSGGTLLFASDTQQQYVCAAWWGADRTGTNDATRQFQLAFAAADTVKASVGTYKIATADVIGGENKTFQISRGAIFECTVDGVSFEGFIIAATDQQIFTGAFVPALDITTEYIHPGWFGVTGDGATDNGEALERIYDNVFSDAVIFYSSGNYNIENTGTTTITSGSNGIALPTSTINVANTIGFYSVGHLYVTTGAGAFQLVTYTGKTATSFTGCSGGTGTMSTGGAVVQTVLLGSGNQFHKFSPGSVLVISGYVTMTGNIETSRVQQIFGGAGTVVFIPPYPSDVNVSWWGANEGNPNNAPELTKAHNAGADVEYSPGTLSTDTVTLGTTNSSTHHFNRGGILKPNSGQTLTISGYVDAASDQQLFDVSLGSVLFTDNQVIHVGWFGAEGNGTTDDSVAVQKAITAAANCRGSVEFIAGRLYRITAPITVTSAVFIRSFGGTAGGANAARTAAATILHDFDGDLFTWSGTDGTGNANGGGIENMRLVQVYGSPSSLSNPTPTATNYGSALVFTGTDIDHRTSWFRVRNMNIEEVGGGETGGCGSWSWALKIDGTSAGAIADWIVDDVHSHTTHDATGAVFLLDAIGSITNSRFYQSGHVVADYGSNGVQLVDCEGAKLKIGPGGTIDGVVLTGVAGKILNVGGRWNEVNTGGGALTGVNIIHNADLDSTPAFTGSGNYKTNQRLADWWYDAGSVISVGRVAGVAGAWRTSKTIAIENGIGYAGIKSDGKTALGLIQALTQLGVDSVRINSAADSAVAIGAPVHVNLLSPGEIGLMNNVGIHWENAAGTDILRCLYKDSSNNFYVGEEAASVTIGGASVSTTIAGNLTVSGTTTTMNSTVVDITDRVIHVNHTTGTVAVPSQITGISVHRGNTGVADRDHVGLFWDESASRFKLAFNTTGDDSTLGTYLSLTVLGLNVDGLTASQAVVTDSSKNLASLAYDTASTASALVQRDGSGKINVGSINVSDLTASQAVVTDGSKNLTSLAYASAATASALVQRDGSGNGTFVGLTLTSHLNMANSTYLSQNSGAVLTVGFDGTRVRVGADGGTPIVFGSPNSATNVGNGDLLIANAKSIYEGGTGGGDSKAIEFGAIRKLYAGGAVSFSWETNKISFFGGATAAKQTITGAVTSITDANAKAAIQSIIAALVAYSQVTDGTT